MPGRHVRPGSTPVVPRLILFIVFVVTIDFILRDSEYLAAFRVDLYVHDLRATHHLYVKDPLTVAPFQFSSGGPAGDVLFSGNDRL